MNAFNEPNKTRAAQRLATANSVLEAARAEFERVGFERANLRSIAKRANVSAGTVLHHYADKTDLLHAALFEDLDRTLKDAIGAIEPGPLEEQLNGLAKRVFASYQRRPKLSRTLLKESLFAAPPWAARFTSQTTHVHGAVAGLLDGAIRRKEFPKTLDPSLFGVAWLSFFYFALISWAQGAHEKPVALVAALTAQHLGSARRTKGTRS